MLQVLDQVRQTIEQNWLLSEAETLIVGVSGGPDSLCLLHILCRLQRTYDLTLHVAHLHHGLRDADADADADFVRTLAADWGLPCTIERADVSALACEHRLAVEEAARRARYAFLGRVARTLGAQTIAVGHNADDQTETVLMHWLRGSGLAGLRGMLPLVSLSDYRLLAEDMGSSFPISDSPISDLRLIRPLLEVPRADIEAYCDDHGLDPRFDRSNLDTTYFRNWLRHELIPQLARHNPNVQEVIRRSARVIAGDYALLRLLLEETWPGVVLEELLEEERIVFDLTAWRALPLGLQRSTLREAVHHLRRSLRNINFLHVENARCVACDGVAGNQATLPRGLMLTVGYDRFVIARADATGLSFDWPLLSPACDPLVVDIPGVALLPESNWMLKSEVLERAELAVAWEANADPWRAFLDADVVGDRVRLRTRRPGDRFQPLGMGGHTTKLADFMTNQKVPQAVRDRLPLLEGREGLVWICGQRVDERARVRDDTKKVLVLSFAHS